MVESAQEKIFYVEDKYVYFTRIQPLFILNNGENSKFLVV